MEYAVSITAMTGDDEPTVHRHWLVSEGDAQLLARFLDGLGTPQGETIIPADADHFSDVIILDR